MLSIEKCAVVLLFLPVAACLGPRPSLMGNDGGTGGAGQGGSGGVGAGGTAGGGGSGPAGTGGTAGSAGGSTGAGGNTGAAGMGGGAGGAATSSGGSTGTGGATTGTGGAPGTGGAATSAGGSTGTGGATIGTGGATGTGGAATGMGGASGTGGSFGQPGCGTTSTGVAIAKGVTCIQTDLQLCYKTCGPSGSNGVKSETCTTGTYSEMIGCSFDPANNYSCYKIPATQSSACPTTIPMAGQGCTVAACTICTMGGMYLDSSAATKVGFCICDASSGKWSCAATNAWPCPGNSGC